ncbi:lamin tail domain-containing protein [Ancylomarina sp. 16SWW S1-10-2]|uniref:lamin tail domain-containing protein n=1 Tax=Ancylomarina sp. 16SWW S1-10-2 TaxID=2499681 RepID=UPI0012AE9C1A|nr:lamin tail domain-containing protein [Ancylomarina sp. 16SWW S1-10-2]MRT91602.1 hypothetical protein [Ancylomarina sp. 16SWW S1-10-2]
MKVASFFKVLFLFLLSSGFLQAQDIVYSENFNDDVGQGNDGGTVNLSAVDWTLNTDACNFETGDYVKVVDTGDDRLEAIDCDGEAVWMSPIIDISNYSNLDISIYTAETGSGSNADNKYVKLYYILDGGSEVSFFESAVDWGNFTATINNLNGNTLQLVARMKTTYSSDKIYIDDISVKGILNAVSKDALTQVLSPVSQIPSQTISSVINDESSSQTLLKFALSESASSDNLDTKIASIKFKNIAITNQADLLTQFGGFSIYDGTNFIVSSSISIGADDVTLNFAEGVFSLLDNGSQEYELKGFLKSSGILDGNIVAMELSASDITTYASGSGFDTVGSVTINSPEHQISVIATQLNFTSIPSTSLIKNISFSVSLNASDVNGNIDIDIDANQTVDLSIQTGTGILSGVLSKTLLNGEAVFADLTYNMAENISIQASALDLDPAISDPISIISSQSTDLTISNWTPSSLNISSISNTIEDAVEVYRFSINDIGDDSESTFLNSIRLIPGDNNNVVWENVMAGLVVKVGDDILESTYVLSNSAIDITIPSSELLREVPDGNSKAFSIFVYLKTEINDGDILQMNIENSHSSWLTSGSGFVPNFVGDFNGPEFKIDVIGTQLNFTSIPEEDVEFASNFMVSVNLSDRNNNLDVNANQEVSLALVEGNGDLSGTLTKNLSSGIVSFDDLSYNYSESINLVISGDGLESDESEAIHILPSNSSTAQVVNWMPDNLKISSLSVSEDDFKEVFRFQIIDSGDDQVSSVLKSIRLISGTKNTMDWEDNIGGFRLKINDEIADVDFIPSASSLLINFAENDELANIPDGQAVDLSLYVYLDEKSSDGQIFQAAIENSHSQWELDGTQLLPEFTGDFEGDSFVVDVEGTELSFTEKPSKDLIPNTDFGMELKLVDKFGNQDLNSIKDARVSLASGTGNLTSDLGLSVNLINGKYVWTDLRYDKAENFTLLIEVDGLESILTDNISSLDANSSLIAAETPLLQQVLNPLSIDIENAEAVLNFVIKDEASKDNLPTRVSSMTFYNTLIGSGLDWKKHLAGAILKSNGEIVANTTKIENEYISFSSADIEIENGEQKEFELGIYFKKSLIPDHAKFQVEIRKDHEWKTSSTGSSLIDQLLESIQSPIHEIDVIADRLSFISYPKEIEDSENFKLRIAAVDEFQNIDIDHSSSISLSSESGVLSRFGVVGNLADGVLEIDDLSFSGEQILKLTASSDLEFFTKELFVQEKNIIFSDDFESNDLSLWEHTDAWTASSYKPINGSFSLKHNLTNATGNSYIICPLNNIQVGSESIFWEFILHNSDWDPTSSNNFVFHLLMDANNPELAENFYSVGINLSGSDDCLSLWASKDENTERLIKSDFDWNKEETVAVKVEYNSQGEWILSYNRLGNNSHWLDAGTASSEANTDIENWYSGLAFNFGTASRAGELWFDNLKIETYNTSPYLRNYEFSSDSLVLNFSENLNILESSKLDNFELSLGGEPLQIKEIKSTNINNQLILLFENSLVTGNYKLKLNSIEDLDGAISKTDTIQFDYYEETKEYDLVINEILADESPVVGLPEYEFIEIYNTSDYPINIKDYKLKVGNAEKILSDFEIPSKAYLILCSNAAVEFYEAYGHVLGVSSFPSLTNSGTNISLESSSGMLIDEITYSSDWYGDDEKKDGGWSLERIDATNHSWQVDNWRASIDAKGGTPGQINSVVDDNKDETAPILLSFDIDQPNSILLYFSETLKSSQVFLLENYSIDNGIGYPNSIVEIDDDRFALRLTFSSDFESNTHYLFTLSDQLSDLAGNLFVDREFKFLLADLPREGDLVINEVLFNPYPNGADYVELLNISDRIIDVKDLFIANRDDNFQIDQSYQISDKSYLLEAGAYLLITTDTANVKMNYSDRDEMAFLEIENMPSYSDDEGRVVLLNSNDEQIDDFAYDESMHFSQLVSDEGVSLERINPEKETNSRSNWISASQTSYFGTPGMQNSSYDIDQIEVNEIGFKSKIFSPDNDGIDDRLVINFNLAKSGYVANIQVYNSRGIEIKRIASNLTLSTKDELFWDGLLANKERAPFGIYIVYFELFNPDGDTKVYKKTCVLGGKFK